MFSLKSHQNLMPAGPAAHAPASISWSVSPLMSSLWCLLSLCVIIRLVKVFQSTKRGGSTPTKLGLTDLLLSASVKAEHESESGGDIYHSSHPPRLSLVTTEDVSVMGGKQSDQDGSLIYFWTLQSLLTDPRLTPSLSASAASM